MWRTILIFFLLLIQVKNPSVEALLLPFETQDTLLFEMENKLILFNS